MTKCESGSEREHKQEDEDDGPNVYNCVSLSERQAGALALQQDFRSSIPSYSMLHALCSAPHALRFSSRPGDEAELVVLLQMGMSRQDADTEAVGTGFARRN